MIVATRRVVLLAVLAVLGSLPILSAEESPPVRSVEIDKITLSVPEAWKQQQPSNNLRLAQFAIDAVEGDMEGAELVIFPPFGGTAEANIERWIGQFDAEGREVKMTQGEAPQGSYVFVDLAGTYKKPDGPPVLQKFKPAPGFRMYGVIFKHTAGGNYFFKLTGPDQTVSAAQAAFRKSFGADAEKEQEYKLDQ
jgi:gluconolactonase